MLCLTFLAVEGQVHGAEYGVRAARVWRSVLGIEHTVIESVEIEAQGEAEIVMAGTSMCRGSRPGQGQQLSTN